jgi:hypothetical protein
MILYWSFKLETNVTIIFEIRFRVKEVGWIKVDGFTNFCLHFLIFCNDKENYCKFGKITLLMYQLDRIHLISHDRNDKSKHSPIHSLAYSVSY